jgi:hypothetical protein
MFHHHLPDFPKYFNYSHWVECAEFTASPERECRCALNIEGCHPLTSHYKHTVPAYDGTAYVPRKERFYRLLDHLEAEFVFDLDGHPISRVKGSLYSEISRTYSLSQNCSLIHPPVPFESYPEAIVLPSMSEEVTSILHAAEKLYWRDLEVVLPSGYRIAPFQHMHISPMIKEAMTATVPIKSLKQLAFEAASPMCWVKQGLVISSSAALSDNGGSKVYDVMTSYCRPVRGLKPEMAELAHLFPLAIDMVTHMCGSTAELGLHEGIFDLETIINSMYLGSAGGINGPQGILVGEYAGIRTEANPNGKKFEVAEAALLEFINFVTKDVRPFGSFKVSYKQENYFCDRPEDVERKSKKGRIYVIPNLIIILMEHAIGLPRILELGGAIGIGRSWSWGGWDALLIKLGVMGALHEYDANEGDITKIDQSLMDVLINLFFSSRLRYFDKKHPFYPYVRKIVRFLIEEFTQKVTHIIGKLWAVVAGGVPSGAFHTSHMDSWILLFLFCLFCLDMRQKYPQYADEIMVAMLTRMIITVYGDDNLYFTKKGWMTEILGARAWGVWLMRVANMELRDIRVGHPVVSVPKNGFFSVKGCVYLRHYCVENPSNMEGQAKYVPYRPMKEIVLKVAYGREPAARDPVNLLLSTLGHAYGTYGSNYYSYSWLKAVYTSIFQVTGKPFESFFEHIDRAEKDVIKKLRQMDMTPEELKTGFPTMEVLREKNKFVPSKHFKEALSARAAQAYFG